MKTAIPIIAALFVLTQSAFSQEPDTTKAVEELKKELATRDQIIRNLIQRIERLEAIAANSNAPSENRGQTEAQQRQEVSPEQQAAQIQDVERIRAAFERTLIDRGGLTLSKWTWEIDTGLTYGHSSSEALTIDGFTVYPVLIVGDIVSERVRRDTMGLSLGGRIGLPWQVQADVRVPYTYENNSRLSAAGEETSLSDHGLGDIEIGFSRPLWQWKERGIDFLGALRWKTTTGDDPFESGENRIPFGTGFHALSASVTAVAAQDPMVFFGTLSYTNDLPTTKDGRSINPGDSFGLQLGTALAVNLDTTLSFGFQQQYTNRTRVDGVPIAGSYINSSSFTIGLAHALASGRTFDTGLVVGLSEDSPDVQLNFSMPFRKPSR